MVAALCALLVWQNPKWIVQPLAAGSSVAFPTKPKPAQIPPPKDGTTNMRVYLAVVPGAAYVSGSFDLPSGSATTPVDKSLAIVAAGFLNGAKGSFTSQRDLVLNGWPGLEVGFKGVDGLAGRCQAYRLGLTVVEVSISYLAKMGEPKDSASYFGSLKLPQAPKEKAVLHPGPELKMVDLGDSGITVQLPNEPVRSESQVGEGANKGAMVLFTSEYGNRTYRVAYRDVPDGANLGDDPNPVLEYISDDLVKSISPATVEKKRIDYRGDPALRCDMTFKGGISAAAVTVAHGRRFVTMLAIVPTPLLKSTEVTGYLSSLKVKSAP